MKPTIHSIIKKLEKSFKTKYPKLFSGITSRVPTGKKKPVILVSFDEDIVEIPPKTDAPRMFEGYRVFYTINCA